MNLRKRISIFILVIAIISLIGLITYSLSFEAFISRREYRDLDITDVDFTYGNATTGQIIISVINLQKIEVTVSAFKVNSTTVTSWTATDSATLAAGATETFTIKQAVTAGNKYSILIFEKEGTMVGSFTGTA
jgi:hypothetical protein